MLDPKYSVTAERMRELAINQYGCSEFTAATEVDYEIAISYWKNLEQIKKWKQGAEHLAAQELGRTIWYNSYKVEITKIVHQYGSSKH